MPLTNPADPRFARLPGLCMHYLDWPGLADTVPALIVRGAHSDVFPPDNLARLRGLMPRATSVEIDADHRVSQDNPQALAAAIDRFVEGCASS